MNEIHLRHNDNLTGITNIFKNSAFTESNVMWKLLKKNLIEFLRMTLIHKLCNFKEERCLFNKCNTLV